MADKKYENFDIHIGEVKNGSFPISVTHTEKGAKTRQTFLQSSPLDDYEFSDVVDYVHDLIATQQDAKTLGEKLRKLLFPDAIWDLFNQRYGVTQNEGRRLRLRLQIESIKLSCLPWELCYFDTRDSFFALLPQTPLIRYIAEPFAEGDITAVPTPVKVLLATANPRQDLQIKNETERIMEALAKLGDGVEIIPLPDANISTLQDALDKQKPHVLHFIGHGQQGKLLLTNPKGEEVLLPAESVRSVIRIAAAESLKVVVLNACHTASPNVTPQVRADVRETGLGVAQAILREGVPAVIAMQTLLPDKIAAEFAYKLYDQLAQATSLDEAVTAMRLRAHAIANQNEAKPEWGGYFGCMPVLFMRDSGEARVWKPRDAVARQPEKVIVSTAAFDSFLDLNYAKQSRAFRRVQQATASLLSSEPDEFNDNKNNLRLLLRRLLYEMPNNVTIQPLKLDTNPQNPLAATSSDEYWFQLATHLQLDVNPFKQPYNDNDKQVIAQAVARRLASTHLVIIVERLSKKSYLPVIDEFWQPLQAMLPSSPFEHRLILFLLDYKGYRLVNPNYYPVSADVGFHVDLPAVEPFVVDDLLDWFYTVRRDRRADDRLKALVAKDQVAHDIIAASEQGSPEKVLEYICKACGYQWDGEEFSFSKWLKP